MKKEVRCPRCNRRLFDVEEEIVGKLSIQCKCRNRVLVRFDPMNRIALKTK